MEIITKMLKKIISLFGYRIEAGHLKPHDIRRKKILNNIDVVVDIGANEGQYAEKVRNSGYKKAIISFEPLSRAYSELRKKSEKDDNWSCNKKAIGRSKHKTQINVSKNSYSSSILELKESHKTAAPQSKFVKKEKVEVETLDSIIEEVNHVYKNIMVKIDTQGYEYNVLKGGKSTLSMVDFVELEVSMRQMYSGEKTVETIFGMMYEEGFELISINEGLTGENNYLLQADCLFMKKD